MAKPLPLPVWDRQSGKLFSEWMDDHTPTYESEPRRSVTQWIKSQPLYDRLYAAYQNTRWSARQIEPFVRRYHIDLSEFEPVKYRSFAQFFDRRSRRNPTSSARACARYGVLVVGEEMKGSRTRDRQ
jgi:phosphatidylserine decarboxylase